MAESNRIGSLKPNLSSQPEDNKTEIEPRKAEPEDARGKNERIKTNALASGPSKTPIRFLANAKEISELLFTFGAWSLFTLLYCLFVYYVLIQGRIQVGSTVFDASTANLLVSIFSQIYVTLTDMTLRGLLSALRLALLVNQDSYLVTFFGISPSTDWLSVIKLFALAWLPNLWRACTYRYLGEGSLLVARLGLPIMGLAYGSVLKFQATFDYYFVPGPSKLDVFAGLIPLHNQVLNAVQTATLCLYFQSWTASLLENNKYANSIFLDGCGERCRSVFLPGGVEMVRQVSSSLNISMFDGNLLSSAETISIEDAPGFILRFQNVENGYPFDSEVDCLYTGRSINDTFQICVDQVDNQSIAVGWAACPQEIKDANNCSADLSWSITPLRWTTIMSVYKQFADTTYNRQNFSMVNFRTNGDPEPLSLASSEYLTIFKKILLSNALDNSVDNSSIDDLNYSLTWLHRTYTGYFPDDQNSLLTNLHNLLAIPFQFTITAYQFANSTSTLLPFPMPADSQTVATGGWSSSKLTIQSWTGYLFISTAGFLFLATLVGIVWILFLPTALPYGSGIGDLDSLNLARWVTTSRGVGERLTLLEFGTGHQAVQKRSSLKLAKDIGSWRVSLGDNIS
ncbi:hypothetical protein BX600DRAFT_540210 [Xylariales sp. PMI_506]|nr:hypothetical protein BX600DRAFT_540210 [Xylariales sp. PMI_506]